MCNYLVGKIFIIKKCKFYCFLLCNIKNNWCFKSSEKEIFFFKKKFGIFNYFVVLLLRNYCVYG